MPNIHPSPSNNKQTSPDTGPLMSRLVKKKLPPTIIHQCQSFRMASTGRAFRWPLLGHGPPPFLLSYLPPARISMWQSYVVCIKLQGPIVTYVARCDGRSVLLKHHVTRAHSRIKSPSSSGEACRPTLYQEALTNSELLVRLKASPTP